MEFVIGIHSSILWLPSNPASTPVPPRSRALIPAPSVRGPKWSICYKITQLCTDSRGTAKFTPEPGPGLVLLLRFIQSAEGLAVGMTCTIK